MSAPATDTIEQNQNGHSVTTEPTYRVEQWRDGKCVDVVEPEWEGHADDVAARGLAEDDAYDYGMEHYNDGKSQIRFYDGERLVAAYEITTEEIVEFTASKVQVPA